MKLGNIKNIFSLSPKTYLWMLALVIVVVAAVNRIPQLRSLIS